MCVSFLQSTDPTIRWRSARAVGRTATTPNTWTRSSAPSKVCVCVCDVWMHRWSVNKCVCVCLCVSLNPRSPKALLLSAWLVSCVVSCVCSCFYTSLCGMKVWLVLPLLFFSSPWLWTSLLCVWIYCWPCSFTHSPFNHSLESAYMWYFLHFCIFLYVPLCVFVC